MNKGVKAIDYSEAAEEVHRAEAEEERRRERKQHLASHLHKKYPDRYPTMDAAIGGRRRKHASLMNDLPVTLRNIVQQLQAEPQRYRLFGMWWWPVKATLRHVGYGPDQCFLLGEYVDTAQAASVPALPLAETLAEYQQNATFPDPDGMVEDPEGEMVEVWDSDAAGA